MDPRNGKWKNQRYADLVRHPTTFMASAHRR